MVAIALNVITAEAGEFWYEAEWVFFWWHLDSYPSIVYLGCSHAISAEFEGVGIHSVAWLSRPPDMITCE